jgi:hypothetical protein
MYSGNDFAPAILKYAKLLWAKKLSLLSFKVVLYEIKLLKHKEDFA